MSDVMNRFIRVLCSGIIGWAITLLATFLATIGIDPKGDIGQSVFSWISSFEPIFVVIMAASVNALIAKLADKYPNLAWLERLLNPINGKIPVYVINDKV